MTANLLKNSTICFRYAQQIALLQQFLPSTPQSSYSFVLSLAHHLNDLHPLTFPTVKTPQRPRKECSGKTGKTEPEKKPNYFEAWCDYLFELVTNGDILVMGGVAVLVATVSNDFFEQLQLLPDFDVKSSSLTIQQKLGQQHLASLFSIRQTSSQISTARKIAIINFSTSTLNPDKLKPKVHLEGLLTGILFNAGDIWKSFRILKQDIPTVAELTSYDTIILSGSSYSVNNIPEQIVAFKEVLIQSLEANKELKVMGICFGHQFLAWIHGVEVITKPLNKGTDDVRFELGGEKENRGFLEGFEANGEDSLRLYKYHNDHVTSTPRGFVNLASSEKCGVEALLSLDSRMFTFQFHPEFTEEYIHHYEKRWEQYHGRQKERQDHKLDTHHHGSLEKFRKSMRNFIDALM